jgi:hypothetical protein
MIHIWWKKTFKIIVFGGKKTFKIIVKQPAFFSAVSS